MKTIEKEKEERVYHKAEVKTEIPGPLSRKYLEKQERLESNARTYPRGIQIAIERSSGPYIEDVDGNVFIDFLTGAGVLALGHNHPEIIEKVKEQLDRCSHTLDITTENKENFTESLISKLPAEMQDQVKVHFCGPTGSDSVEAAIKLCKNYTKRSTIISFQGAYHGSSHGTMAITGLLGPKKNNHSLMPGVHFFPYAYCYQCPLGLEKESCTINCAKLLRQSLEDPNSGVMKPSAIIMEMIQGEGGSIPAPKEFVQEIRQITLDHDIPLIIDEIQTGMGRTGKWFAFQQYDIIPDVITVSKALGGIGMPISVIIYNKKMDTWDIGTHIGTFRGNQLAFAAGREFMNIMERDNILENVKSESQYIYERLETLKERYSILGDVRGIGMMIGVEIKDPTGKKRESALAKQLKKIAIENGLIIELGGRDDKVIRLLPPLNVPRDVVIQALEILEIAINKVENEL